MKLLHRQLLTIIIASSLTGALHADPVSDASRINTLIKQLADDNFTKRKAAGRALEAEGEKALPFLRTAAAASKDLDLSQQLQQVSRAIMRAAGKSKSTGLELVLIVEGEFEMGSKANERNRKPDELSHNVKITRPFLLGSYEVTQAEYKQVMKQSPSWFSSTGTGSEKVKGIETDRFPVESVNWFDAINFCNQLSILDKYEPYYKVTEVVLEGELITKATVTIAGGTGYRLPTEAEWEYACRAKSTTRFHFGNDSDGTQGNIKSVPATGYAAPPRKGDVGRTTKVGSYAANDWGLYDMHGNVSEWCWDWHDREYYGKSPVEDPPGPAEGTYRILRGGNWLVSNSNCRSACRFSHVPVEKGYYTGFRVARTP